MPRVTVIGDLCINFVAIFKTKYVGILKQYLKRFSLYCQLLFAAVIKFLRVLSVTNKEKDHIRCKNLSYVVVEYTQQGRDVVGHFSLCNF